MLNLVIKYCFGIGYTREPPNRHSMSQFLPGKDFNPVGKSNLALKNCIQAFRFSTLKPYHCSSLYTMKFGSYVALFSNRFFSLALVETQFGISDKDTLYPCLIFDPGQKPIKYCHSTFLSMSHDKFCHKRLHSKWIIVL